MKDANKNSPPRYLSIADDLNEKIKSKIYPEGSMLPKEIDLEVEYGVSRITIRKAMQLLCDWNVIVRKRGSGTYVKRPSAQHNAFQLTGFVEEISSQGKTPSSKIITFEMIKSSKAIAQKLLIPTGTEIYSIRRLRLIDAEPEVLEHTYLPYHLFPDLSIEVMMKSKYDYIENQKGLKIESSRQVVSAVLLNNDLANILNCELHKAVIRVDSIGKLDDGSIFEYSIHHFRGYQYEFEFLAKRSQ